MPFGTQIFAFEIIDEFLSRQNPSYFSLAIGYSLLIHRKICSQIPLFQLLPFKWTLCLQDILAHLRSALYISSSLQLPTLCPYGAWILQWPHWLSPFKSLTNSSPDKTLPTFHWLLAIPYWNIATNLGPPQCVRRNALRLYFDFPFRLGRAKAISHVGDPFLFSLFSLLS